ncbi:MAG: PE-PPE domain-containing protein [Mycobacterium sp.]
MLATHKPRPTVRIARSIGVAFLALLTAAVLGLASTISPAVQLLAKTALIMSGTFTPDPPPAFVEMAMNQFIRPTHPGQTINPIAVETPEQAWPVTGLFDLPFGRSVAVGQQDLEDAMAAHGNDKLVIFGHSQSSVIAYREKRKLAEQFPEGTTAPDIDFVTIGTLNLPNGGVMTRFWGLYLPFVDFYFNGPLPSDTQFDTYVITQRWDGFADFPIYPIILPAVANAVLGFFYVHEEYADVTLAPDPQVFSQGTHGDTTYYFFETQNLPLYGPLRSFGVPEPLIDFVEPLSIFVVELGYRRDIPPWVPSPARLIPVHDPVDVVDDFVEAVDQTIDNTLTVLGSPPPLTIPAPVSSAARSSTGSEASTSSGPAALEVEEPVGDQPDTNNEGVIGTTAAPDPGAAEPTADRATTDRHRPTLRGPAGVLGPRIRDLFHRVRNGLPASTSTGGSEVASSEDSQEGATPSTADGS